MGETKIERDWLMRLPGCGEFRVLTVRETPLTLLDRLVDTPERASEYWHGSIATDVRLNPDVESFYVLLLNARRKILGSNLVAIGSADSVTVHAREVFRVAIVAGAVAVILMHNHPTGDPSPSEADIKVTRDLIRAGQLLKIDVLDHVVMGQPGEGHERGFTSLRELGYFFS